MNHNSPCRHMPLLLSGLSDGTLTGLARWYATHHTQGCPRCAATLAELVETRKRLHALCAPSENEFVPLSLLSPDRRARVEAAWAAMEAAPLPPNNGGF